MTSAYTQGLTTPHSNLEADEPATLLADALYAALQAMAHYGNREAQRMLVAKLLLAAQVEAAAQFAEHERKQAEAAK